MENNYQKAFKIIIAFITAWMIFDALTTWFVLTRIGNYDVEINPIMNFLMHKLGLETTLILTRVAYLSFIYVIYESLKYGKKLELFLMILLVFFVIGAIIGNTIAVFRILFF